jgi:hypothetical protein
MASARSLRPVGGASMHDPVQGAVLVDGGVVGGVDQVGDEGWALEEVWPSRWAAWHSGQATQYPWSWGRRAALPWGWWPGGVSHNCCLQLLQLVVGESGPAPCPAVRPMVEVPARSQGDGGEGVETGRALVGTIWVTARVTRLRCTACLVYHQGELGGTAERKLPQCRQCVAAAQQQLTDAPHNNCTTAITTPGGQSQQRAAAA